MPLPLLGGDCPACEYLEYHDIEQYNVRGDDSHWRAPEDYDDLFEAFRTGVPIHDSDGDCIKQVVRAGWSRVEGDKAAAVYSIHRATSQAEYIRPIATFSIWVNPVPTEEEVAGALETIRRSLVAKALTS